MAYGFDSAQSVVWLEAVDPDRIDEVRGGMVCRRHGDSMSAPRGWSLDDRRETRPTLFGPPDMSPGSSIPATPDTRRTAPRTKRAARSVDLTGELPFDLVGIGDVGESAVDEAPAIRSAAPVADNVAEPPHMPGAQAVLDPDETKAIPWSPHFDQTDDLGGLLRAESPLLARAFGRRPVRERRVGGQRDERP